MAKGTTQSTTAPEAARAERHGALCAEMDRVRTEQEQRMRQLGEAGLRLAAEATELYSRFAAKQCEAAATVQEQTMYSLACDRHAAELEYQVRSEACPLIQVALEQNAEDVKAIERELRATRYAPEAQAALSLRRDLLGQCNQGLQQLQLEPLADAEVARRIAALMARARTEAEEAGDALLAS